VGQIKLPKWTKCSCQTQALIVWAFLVGEKPKQANPSPHDKSHASNIIPCGWNVYKVGIQDYGIKQGPNEVDQAFTIDFKNQPLETNLVGKAASVQAELTYMSSGEIYLRVDHGLWLGESFYSTRMEPNTKRGVVFLLLQQHTRDFIAVGNERDDINRTPPLDFDVVIRENDKYTIEVHLTIDGIRRGPYKYMLILKPEFDFRPI
jgi:hypothetical protein